MAIIKCKMCGGDLEITEGVTVAECEYCGTRQTVPSADSEKKLTLFSRANRLRLANEFDKAAGVYENIVAEFPTEAEAYWGLVLCRYGIEYVDDPATGKKVPTCHRLSFDSILEDGDFEQACENADAIARRVYREEAKVIEDIRRGILEVSGKEQPYDVFICYKETDENGQRTIDSVLAQDVYDALTEKGWRVFFSRVTLEDKLGTEYEPYIFAALNSAKVMLAFGTDYEYFNAVWVKNEWSRYLKLMAQDKGKHLIPCYKGIDAYDMPKEFAKLQAQDMGKVGAVQDLLRGIDKLLGRGAAAQPAPAPVTVQSEGGPTVESLLKRGQMLLEDKDWDHADEYFDKVLDIDPECAEAYVGKLCAVRQYRRIAWLAEDSGELSGGEPKLWERAMEFASPELRAQLEEYQAKGKAWREEKEEQQKKEREDRRKRLAPIRARVSKAAPLIAVGHYNSIFVVDKKGDVYSGYPQKRFRLYGKRWRDMVAVSASKGSHDVVGLKSDGTVVSSCSWSDKLPEKPWHDIVAVACGEDYFLGLQSDGVVVAAQRPHSAHPRKVSDWRDIVAISAEDDQAFGLRADGTVVADGNDADIVSGWTDIVAIASGGSCTVGLRADGTVVTTLPKSMSAEVQDWTDIVAIDVASGYVVGLKSDGTVVSVWEGFRREACKVSAWTDIVAVSMSLFLIVGLKSDGTLVTAGDKVADVSGMKLFNSFDTLEEEIRQIKENAARFPIMRERARKGMPLISAGDQHTIGVKADGSVVAAGANAEKQCNVSAWSDIVAVAAGCSHTVGLKQNGTVVAVGDNGKKQCNVKVM